MKLDEVIPEAGRPIAYYPRLRQIAGSTNAAILLCQLIYWTGKQRDPEGWIQKRVSQSDDHFRAHLDHSDQDLGDETGLSYKEMRSARRLLRERGFLRERHDYLNHLIFFQIDPQAIQGAFLAAPKQAGSCPEGPSQVAQVDASTCPKAKPEGTQGHTADVPSGKLINGFSRDHAETTAESSNREASATTTGEGNLDSIPEELFNEIPTTPGEALRHPEIRLFREVCGRMPGEKQYRTVIELMNHFRQLNGEATVDFLRPFWLAWSSRRRKSDGQPYDPASLTWLSEWALNGTIPPDQGGMNGSERDHGGNPGERRSPSLSPEQLAALERINAEARESHLPDL